MIDCLACERIKQAKVGKNPYFVRELDTSFVVLSDHQRYEGYSLLLLKEYKEHLWELSIKKQQAFYEDVALTANAMMLAYQPLRLNYENLGNTLAHSHWHLVPRYSDDPEASQPIWVRPYEERHLEVSPDKLKELVGRLKRGFDEVLSQS